MLHGEHDLDEAGDAGSLQRVADVGLHAADGNLASPGQVLRHQTRQCTELRGVAHLGARGMCLDVFESADVSGVWIRPFHGQHLALLPRRPQALSLAVTGHTQAADHGPDPIPVCQGTGQGLDHDRHVAFGGDQAVGVGAERTGPGIAHRLRGREEHEAVGLAERSSAHDRLIDPALEQRPGGDGHRLQRRGTSRIDHQIGAVEAQRLLDDLGRTDGAQIEPPAGLAGRIPAAHIGRHLGCHVRSRHAQDGLGRLHLGKQGRRLVDAVGIDDVTDPRAAAGVAHVHAGAAVARHGKGIHARVPTGLRRHLEEDVVGDVEPLHKIGRQGTGGRIDRPVGHDGTHLRVALADAALVRIEVQVARQARLWERSPSGAALRYQLPEGLDSIGSGEPAGHAHDRERFVQRLRPSLAFNQQLWG